MEYVVIDVETTGLTIGYGHRIIEFAGVRLNRNGDIIAEYETLLNPKRDLGPTHVHGITSAAILGAPSFEEVAGDILDLINGAIVVAHNASFDTHFLYSEFDRMEHPIPLLQTLCTLKLAHVVWPEIQHRALGALCESLAVKHEQAHTAIEDARATAIIFKRAMGRLSKAELLSYSKGIMDGNFPNLPVTERSWKRQAHLEHRSDPSISFLATLVNRLPAASDHQPEIDEYLALLDQALLDRVITDSEAEELTLLAVELNLNYGQIQTAHYRYMQDLVWYALEDNIITEREDRDLQLVSKLLGVTRDELQGMIEKTRNGEGPVELLTQQNHMVGEAVCFTGQLCCCINGERLTRKKAQALAESKGLVIAKAVTKKLGFLVVADPNTQSSKARKAREYDIPVLAETAFWLKLGVEVH